LFLNKPHPTNNKEHFGDVILPLGRNQILLALVTVLLPEYIPFQDYTKFKEDLEIIMSEIFSQTKMGHA
jgi:hypothetical protein